MAGLLIVLVLTACGSPEKETEKKLGPEPPLPDIQTADGVNIKVHQSSYCWTNGCADYIGPYHMLKDSEKQTVAAGAELRVSFEGRQPDQVSVSLFSDDEIVDVSIQDQVFHAPEEAGVYYYLLSASWVNKQNSQVSDGSSAYAFAVEVTGEIPKQVSFRLTLLGNWPRYTPAIH
ncbi:hypothetical protein DNH61_06055 [Paenibacillus sambharensis]|uniref:Uncharacterized protein n=2 Tax=Paenibacillus sambharensis TaxID=1803190 RepID=A0A2W1L987_9BACL|nr:hypothetical protein DNH61_06055 [Paenibacillus sambharensis]